MKSTIFNQHQVNHALKNEEGMFRVVIKLSSEGYFLDRIGEMAYKPEKLQGWPIDHLAPYQVGETIFVKEAFNIFCGQVAYKTTITGNERYFWLPANRMKQEHSRLTLRIKSVKVERLQDISEKDAFRSGYFTIPNREAGESYVSKFREFWNSTHKKPEEKWEASPWVFAYSYEVIKNN